MAVVAATATYIHYDIYCMYNFYFVLKSYTTRLKIERLKIYLLKKEAQNSLLCKSQSCFLHCNPPCAICNCPNRLCETRGDFSLITIRAKKLRKKYIERITYQRIRLQVIPGRLGKESSGNNAIISRDYTDRRNFIIQLLV